MRKILRIWHEQSAKGMPDSHAHLAFAFGEGHVVRAEQAGPFSPGEAAFGLSGEKAQGQAVPVVIGPLILDSLLPVGGMAWEKSFLFECHSCAKTYGIKCANCGDADLKEFSMTARNWRPEFPDEGSSGLGDEARGRPRKH